MTQQQLQFILPILIIVPVLFLRMRRMSKPQPLKPGQLLVRPMLLAVIAAMVLFMPQPGQRSALELTAEEWAGLALAAVLGCVGGWYWGRTMAIEIHPENGTLMTRGNGAAMMVLLLLILVKLGLRPLMAAEGGTMHLDVQTITDASIVFSVALFSVRSLEMYLRAQKVLAAAPGPNERIESGPQKGS
jgi:Protein of unknown function (DUF1453)